MHNFNLLFSDTKAFMANELNRVLVLIFILNILMGTFFHCEISGLKKEISKQHQSTIEQINSAEKKVDYRYFNLTRTLEDINQIKIDTKTGEIKHHN